MNQPRSGEILVANNAFFETKEPRSGETKMRMAHKMFIST